MRTKNLLMMAAVAGAMTLGSCSNNDEFNENSNFPADGVIRVTTNIDAPVTRAGMTSENIGGFNIKINNAANSNYSYYGFYYKPNDVWNCYSDNGATPLTMLWQNSTQQVTVTALSQGSGFTSQEQFNSELQYNVEENQSSELSLLFSDILYMQSKIVNPAMDLVNGKLPITFKHIMSKVNLSITLGTELNTTPGTATNPISELKVNGTITQFKWDASINSVFDLSLFSTKAITPYTGPYTLGSGTTTKAVANYEVILVPQIVTEGGFSVTFTINGQEYTWTSTDAVNLESGKQHNLALTVGKDVVTFDSFSTEAWEPGVGGNLETE